jgi:hypothetical protein
MLGDASLKEIRLFTFSKEQKKDGIVIEMFRRRLTELSSDETFTAVSYAWGQEGDSGVNFLGIIDKDHGSSGFYTVTPNLRDCLTVLESRSRMEARPTWFWIDQICINQECHRDKNVQVNLMPEIYSSAELVIVWTGRKAHLFGLDLFRTAPRYQNRTTPMSMFLERPYWSRLWIRQELQLARDILVLAGEQQLTWTIFAQWIESWQKHHGGQMSNLARQNLQSLHTMGRYRLAARLSGQRPSVYEPTASDRCFITWAQAALLARGTQCSEVKDKAFGLLGCVMPSHRIVVDYNKSVDDIWISILTMSVNKLGSLWSASIDEVCNLMTEYATAMDDWRTELQTTMNPESMIRIVWKEFLPVFGWIPRGDPVGVAIVLRMQLLADWLFRVYRFGKMGDRALSLSQDEAHIVETWILTQSGAVQECGQYGGIALDRVYQIFGEDPSSMYPYCRRSSSLLGSPFHAARKAHKTGTSTTPIDV